MDNWSTIRESWDVRIEGFTLKRRRVFILCTCAWNAWNQAIFDAMEFQRARYISISIIRVDNQSWWKFRCRKFTNIRGGLSLSTNFSIEPRHSDADRFNYLCIHRVPWSFPCGITRNSNRNENHYFLYAAAKEDRSLRSSLLFVTKAFENSRAEYFEGKLDFMKFLLHSKATRRKDTIAWNASDNNFVKSPVQWIRHDGIDNLIIIGYNGSNNRI